MDVTALYEEWRTGARPNHGDAYRRTDAWCENANSTLAVASDATDTPLALLPTYAQWRPKLVITHRADPPTTPPTVEGMGPETVDQGSSITLTAVGEDPEGHSRRGGTTRGGP